MANFVSRIDTVLPFFRVTLPEIGFSYPFVLHSVLALSAIHLARFKRGREQFYRLESERHWNQGFSMATSQVAQVNDEGYHAFFVFSILSCIYKLATGPTPGDYLAFSEQGHEPPEWLIYYKGYHSFMILGIDAMRRGPLAELIECGSQTTRPFFAPTESTDPEPIAELRRLCDSTLGTEDVKHSLYKAAVDGLSRCFSIMLDGKHHGDFNIFVWALNIPQDFIPCIQEREPMALVIFAYFVALLNELSAWWVMDGWVNHLMTGIWDALSVGRRPCIRWPMEQTGWLPP
ncbi:transcription factor [Diplodia seriata]|uniref:Transcription factor n=1 Tax=Diplodia seriata TaxID=420778 RepID=A0ABR3CMB9_9PEZI